MKRSAAASLLLGVAITACSAQDNISRWRGPITPTTQGPTCLPTTALLERHGTTYTFSPNQGTWILRGAAAPDGTITAAQTTIGADKHDYTTTLTATPGPTGVTGTYTTPRCSFQVTLTRL